MAENHPKQADKTNAGVSARKKALLLGKMLGLASEEEYRPSQASIGERSQFRLQKNQILHQLNLETIFSLALNYTPSDVTGEDLDPDWSYQFFQMAEQISSRRMQDLWARILASEIVKPGKFSLRTLAILKQLTQREAQILEKALGMSVKLNTETRYKLLNGYRIQGGIQQYFRKTSTVNVGLSKFGLPYSSILTLMDAGILHSSEFETGILEKNAAILLSMTDHQIKISPRSNNLLFSYYRFTPVGDELCILVQAKADNDFTKALAQSLKVDFNVT
ncbi:TIGR03899 family protein [Shewanella sp. 1_MG-2023]|uniref:TIGR03899 family protein n=1 Tax=unclassified Shewanella TaxID=196818 RepID=UPI0026E4717A|nr:MULTISPECIES: TIGR03899 family protein [unclassified Shewanella]MDO6610506.1 TIGR03899 family protein [Shewanella sp. 7_MG-2023]MDO6770631.1 TIGR03899 family protein [Shewanella sp. 2_MG-2023]MDO6795017.1 TIGR03899 family protein [Shewanella sp. 1_MG-2023]